MKVIVTRQFLNGNEVVKEGTELTVTEARARALMANKLVEPARSELGSGTVRTRRAAQPGAAGPISRKTAEPITAPQRVTAPAAKSTRSRSRPAGGRTGEATPRSSSRQARQPRTRRSTKAEAAPAT